ncbi:helix-turn-helix transcriptional regulator [Emticicia agri]|uniref:AraC family transcriptional regulator n=1 Tax=Emticicia agri TaxID=2492393 RepID=A0A4Q5M0E4_9BACT|nr:AraC family transcriptional regulator [Emticicia agri]RYU95628.1 AraC family transcriptional regulator [Emticicia agri]
MLRVPSSISSNEFESLKIQDMTFVAYRNNVYPSRNEIFFEEHAIVYVLEGEKKFISPTQDIHVQKGQILFFQRGCYSMNESIDTNYRSLVFFFPESLLKEFVAQNLSLFEDSNEGAFEQILSLESTENFDKFVDSLIPFFSARTNLMNQFLKLKFTELMLHLLELDRSNQFKRTLFKIYQGQKIDLGYLLETYYLKPLSIEELARISGRSLSVFKRDFEQQFHASPASWIKNKRLEYASFLLQNTSKNVSEISLEIGYESVSHFIKAFKEKYGFTPKKNK